MCVLYAGSTKEISQLQRQLNLTQQEKEEFENLYKATEVLRSKKTPVKTWKHRCGNIVSYCLPHVSSHSTDIIILYLNSFFLRKQDYSPLSSDSLWEL